MEKFATGKFENDFVTDMQTEFHRIDELKTIGLLPSLAIKMHLLQLTSTIIGTNFIATKQDRQTAGKSGLERRGLH